MTIFSKVTKIPFFKVNNSFGLKYLLTKNLFIKIPSIFILATFLTVPPIIFAQNSDSTSNNDIDIVTGPKLAVAIGHFSRTKSLLIAALREFDKGLKIADPKTVIDVRSWRNTIIAKSDELDHIIDPQPRKTDSGVKYDSDPRLIGVKPEPTKFSEMNKMKDNSSTSKTKSKK